MIYCCEFMNIFKVYSWTIFLNVLLVISNLLCFYFWLTVVLVLTDIWNLHILVTIDYLWYLYRKITPENIASKPGNIKVQKIFQWLLKQEQKCDQFYNNNDLIISITGWRTIFYFLYLSGRGTPPPPSYLKTESIKLRYY